MTAVAYSQSDAQGGRIAHHRLAQDPRIEFLLYTPDSVREGAPLFVTVHGISRNAEEHAELFAPYARACGVMLAAPIFRESAFGKYQRLVSRNPEVPRSDHALLRMLDHLARQTLADTDRIRLFGFSGGGQFAHRFAMAHPDRVHATAIGAAGWYTMPNPDLQYPYGIGPSPDLPDLGFQPERFLRKSFHVLVGPRDVSRDWALRKSELLDELQGQTRVERGERWIQAMRRAAGRLGITGSGLRFDLLAGGRHSFAKAMTQFGLGASTFAALGLAPDATA